MVKNFTFEYTVPQRIVFGAGKVSLLPQEIQKFGRRVLLIIPESGLDKSLINDQFASLEIVRLRIKSEPTLEIITEGVRLAKSEDVEVIVGIGGGSVLDTAKAIGVLVNNPGEPLDYLEVVGKGKSIQSPGIPVIALPTTAGTGAEVTRNAVIGVPSHRMKVSLRSAWLLPALVIIDPELTISVPPNVTAATGMDALAQLIEPYVSIRSNPLTDLYCLEGIRRIAGSLSAAYQDGTDMQARVDMAFASLLGGLALANAGLGAVHGVASPIGGMFSAPHGAVCARLLPEVVNHNTLAALSQSKSHPIIEKYQRIARIVTGESDADVGDLVDWLYRTVEGLAIPRLGSYGITPGDIPEIAEKSESASSMKANPVTLPRERLIEILEKAL
ncbi:MAG TPA: iron-containing alcohol dehydrogenase [Anaerolineaceae bacterium]